MWCGLTCEDAPPAAGKAAGKAAGQAAGKGAGQGADLQAKAQAKAEAEAEAEAGDGDDEEEEEEEEDDLVASGDGAASGVPHGVSSRVPSSFDMQARCNPMCLRLQPYVLFRAASTCRRAATLCV